MLGLRRLGFFGCACTVDPKSTPHGGVRFKQEGLNPECDIQEASPRERGPFQEAQDPNGTVYAKILSFAEKVRAKVEGHEQKPWQESEKRALLLALRTKAKLSFESDEYHKYGGHDRVNTGVSDAEKITRLQRWQRARDAYFALVEGREPRGQDFFALLAIAVDEPYSDANSEQGTAQGECLTTQVKAFFEANPAYLKDFDPGQLLKSTFCCVM